MSANTLAGKKALVTGGARGIGRHWRLHRGGSGRPGAAAVHGTSRQSGPYGGAATLRACRGTRAPRR